MDAEFEDVDAYGENMAHPPQPPRFGSQILSPFSNISKHSPM